MRKVAVYYFYKKFYSVPMNKQTVLVTETIAPSAMARLVEKYNVVSNFDDPEQINAVLTRKISVTKEFMEKAKNLKVIANHGAGTDQIDLQAAQEFGIPVLSAPGLNALSVAELAVGFFISLSFKMKFADQGLAQGKFESFGLPELSGNEISGKKLGILGSGNIARELTRIMKSAFKNDIYCWNPHKNAQQLSELGFTKVDDLETLFSTCDLISVHIPLNSETKNLINRQLLQNANPNLLLVNTARGGIINETDLYEALVNKKIRGAASDVFTKEPPSKDNPLLTLHNFIATPHLAGSTQEALERVGNATVDNIISVLG